MPNLSMDDHTYRMANISAHLNIVSDIAGVVNDGEDWVFQLQLRGAVVSVGLVLTLKLLEERVVIRTWEAEE